MDYNRKRNLKQFLIFALSTGLLSLTPFSSFANSEVLNERLAEAKAQVAQKNFENAEAIYKDLLKQHPEDALPALMRFIRLTRGEEAAQEYYTQLDFDQDRLSNLTQARVLGSIGEMDDAIELLESNDEISNGESQSGVILLSNLYRKLGREDKSEEVLFNALLAAKSNENKRLYFDELAAREKLFQNGDASHYLSLAEEAVNAVGNNRTYLTTRFDPILISLQSTPKYFEVKDQIMNQLDELTPAQVWFTTRMLIREETFEDAMVAIKTNEEETRKSELWPLVAEEKAVLYRSLEQPDEARSLLLTLADENTMDATMRLETARMAMENRDFESSEKILNQLASETLSSDDKNKLWIAQLHLYSSTQNFTALYDVYSKATERAFEEHYELYHKIIFSNLRETKIHHRIERDLRERFEKEPDSTPSTLWRLVAEAANQARRTPNVLEALYQCVLARPDDAVALKALAEEISPVASKLAQLPKEALMVEEEEIQNTIKLAEESFEALIRLQPADPTHYEGLIELYEALEYDNIPDRLLDIIANRSEDASIKGRAAFALAINGYPEAALPVYDDALKIEPKNMQIKMNRAACLTRLDRWEEARDFYRSILEEGYSGRAYHVHEMIDRLWLISVELEEQEACIDYFRDATGRIPEAWRGTAILDIASLLANKERPEEAEEFFQLLLSTESNPPLRQMGFQNLARMYTRAEQFEKAIAVLDKASEEFKSEQELYITLRQVRAEILGNKGETEQAIEEYVTLAENYPDDQLALEGYFWAARMKEEKGNKQEASKLYQSFLASVSTDFYKRQTAEDKLGVLGN